jgi:hypothetical protein
VILRAGSSAARHVDASRVGQRSCPTDGVRSGLALLLDRLHQRIGTLLHVLATNVLDVRAMLQAWPNGSRICA